MPGLAQVPADGTRFSALDPASDPRCGHGGEFQCVQLMIGRRRREEETRADERLAWSSLAWSGRGQPVCTPTISQAGYEKQTRRENRTTLENWECVGVFE